ncbi:hypothetical protein MPH_10356 [Macrophomina phaseolina MS6]|uniref:Zn(2)-C6 fungal-type domain-containing protein n=1 Tax=Macrophomina phaseolina (strain MS6) TaxID=1126212 RepID=K2QRH0_MACPH|nr:hypothetical protein MPH_10356 [Macrophomina phaseolina MS6]
MDSRSPGSHHHHRAAAGARRPPSCLQCQQRKIKCDRKLPCNRCVRGRRTGACFYAVSSTSPSVAQDRVAAEDRSNHDANASGPAGTGDGDGAGNAVHLRTARATSVDVASLERRVKELEERLKDLSNSHNAKPAAGIMSRPYAFRKGRVFGQSHWMHFVDPFPGIVRLDKARRQDADIRITLERCEKLHKQAQTRNAACESYEQRPSLRELVPSEGLARELLDAYLRTIGSVFRILHVPSFMVQYGRFWEDPQSSNEVFISQLLLTLAVGTCFSPQERLPSLHRSAIKWIRSVQNWLMSSVWESRITIPCVQVYCLLLLARQTCSLGATQLWTSASFLLQTSMQLGLHRSPTLMPGVSAFEAEMRRRLWANVAELVVQTSVDAGAAPMLSERDFDCEPPSNIDDEQLHEDDITPPTPRPLDHFTDTTMQILLHRSLPARLAIATHLNHFESDSSYHTTLRLHAELTQCIPSYPHSSTFVLQSEAPSIFQTRLLSLMTHRFLILLHQPFALYSPKDPSYGVSHTACLSTSMFLLSLIRAITQPSHLLGTLNTNTAFNCSDTSIPTSQHISLPSLLPSSWQPRQRHEIDDFVLLMRRGSGMFSEGILRSAIALGFELVAQHDQYNRSNTASSSSTDEKHVSGMPQAQREAEMRGCKAIKDFIELSEERIKTTGDSFKTHLLLMVILAILRSSEAEEEAEVKKVMRESLQFCSDVLKKKWEKVLKIMVMMTLGQQQELLIPSVLGRFVVNRLGMDRTQMRWMIFSGSGW